MSDEQLDETEGRPILPEGIYSTLPPIPDEEEIPPLKERLKDLIAMTLAAYSLLWKPLLCVVAGTVAAWLLLSCLMGW